MSEILVGHYYRNKKSGALYSVECINKYGEVLFSPINIKEGGEVFMTSNKDFFIECFSYYNP